MLPVMVVFAIVAAFATFMMVEYVAREPLVVPPPQGMSLYELPAAAPVGADHAR